MTNSLNSFLEGIVDYAGLFPPAGLDLESALNNYQRYLNGKFHWMLGNFVIPIANLLEANAAPGYSYSVIASPDLGTPEVKRLSIFKGQINMVEICLLPEKHHPNDYTEIFAHIASQLSLTGLDDIDVFIESPHHEAASQAISGFNRTRPQQHAIKRMGFKLRCGGTIPEAYPDIAIVSATIEACTNHEVPIKFTAGMHQPLRNHSELLDTMQHGFINVFAAALLYGKNRINKEEMNELLDEDRFDHFSFSDEEFAWKKHSLTTEEIAEMRRHRVISFGSCSFEEPLDGLLESGLL